MLFINVMATYISYVYVMTTYVCLLNSRLLLAPIVRVFRLVSFVFDYLSLLRNSESATFVAMILIDASSG